MGREGVDNGLEGLGTLYSPGEKKLDGLPLESSSNGSGC